MIQTSNCVQKSYLVKKRRYCCPYSSRRNHFLSLLFFFTCALPHLLCLLPLCHSSCIPLSSFYLTSIWLQFILIYQHGCCINSGATLWEYISKRGEKTYMNTFLNSHLRVTACLSHGTFTCSSVSTHSSLAHLLPHLCAPSFPLRNLLRVFQQRMTNIRRRSAVQQGAQLPSNHLDVFSAPLSALSLLISVSI